MITEEKEQGPFAAIIMRGALCGGLSRLGREDETVRRGLEKARNFHRDRTAILIAEAMRESGTAIPSPQAR